MPQYRLKNCMVSSWIGWVVTADTPEEAYIKLRTYIARVLSLPARLSTNTPCDKNFYSPLGKMLRTGFEIEECIIDRGVVRGLDKE